MALPDKSVTTGQPRVAAEAAGVVDQDPNHIPVYMGGGQPKLVEIKSFMAMRNNAVSNPEVDKIGIKPIRSAIKP